MSAKDQKKTDKRKWLKCEFCQKKKQDTEKDKDPYAYEIWGDDTLHSICVDCYGDRAQDV